MIKMNPVTRRLGIIASGELKQMGQTPLLNPLTSVRPSIWSAIGLAAFGLGSQLVPKKDKKIRGAMLLGMALSGLSGVYFFSAGK
jgi:hypothetical protein